MAISSHSRRGSEREGVVVAVGRLGDLLLVDQLAVHAAGFASAQDVGGNVGIRVAGREGGRREPGEDDLGKLDGVGDDGAALGGDGRRDTGGDIDVGARGDGTEVFVDQRFDGGRIVVAGDGDGGVVGLVVLGEELADVVEAGCFNIGMGADDISVIGWVLGKSSWKTCSSTMP